MDFNDLLIIFDRIKRFQKKLSTKAGEGMSWSFKFEGGLEQFYSISGLKSPEEVEDEIYSAFIWLWTIKDHVKKYSIKKGKTKDWIEKEVNKDHLMCICADIANKLKHGELNMKSRSDKNPKLGKLKYIIPKDALKFIRFKASDINMNVNNSEIVKLEMPILDYEDNALGDAFKFLEHGIKFWEDIFKEMTNN